MSGGEELPEGWAWTTIADVTSYVQRGKGPKYAASSALPVVNQKSVRWWGVDVQHLKYVDESQWKEWGSERFLRDGDVLWNSTGTGTIGRAALFRSLPMFPRMVADSHVTILRPSFYEPRLLHRWIQSPTIQARIADMQNGSTNQVELAKGEVLSTEIPVPPLNEQKRIVAKIDALTEKSREAREALDEVPALLDKLRQSILTAAFRGDLTREWRTKNPDVEPASVLLERIRQERRKKWEEAQLAKFKAKGKLPKDDSWKKKYVEPQPVDTEGLPDLPPSWCWASLDCLLSSIEAGKSPQAAGVPAGGNEYGVLKVSAVSWGQFLPHENKKLADDFAPPERAIVRGGDLLISRANTVELVGAVVLVDRDYPRLMLSDKTLRLVPASPFVRKELLLHALRTQWVRRIFEADATGTSDSMRNLSQERILNAPIVLPPLDEQAELVSILDASVAYREQSERLQTRLLAALTQFDSSILAQAFRGELVPQDPNDEPASVLLERIRTERRANEKKGRGRRRGTEGKASDP